MASVTTTAYTSAGPMLSLLDEPDHDLRGEALVLMNDTVHLFWSELASAVTTIESLADDDAFPHRALAASVASKIYYYMSEPADAVRLALSAGDLFSVTATDSYSQSVVATCIDGYTASQRARCLAASASEDGAEAETAPAELDPRIERIVERVIEGCFASDNSSKDALGLSVQTCRLDLIESMLIRSPAPAPLMKYLYTTAMTAVDSKPLRDSLVRLLVKLYTTAPSQDNTRPSEGAGESAASAATELSVTSDVLALCQCLFYLDQAERVAEVLTTLACSPSERDTLLAFQVR